MSREQQPSRARHLLVLGAAALALGALVALVVLGIRIAAGNGEEQTSPTPTTGDGSSTTDSAAAAREWETDPDTGLPIGAAFEDGRPVQFPHTTEGATAMVVELNRAQIGLDYDQSVATTRIYAAEVDQAFFDDLATDAIAQRREALDIPADGEAAEDWAPAGYAQTPIGYQVEEYGPDRYLVSVLNEVTTTTINGQVDRSAYVGQQIVEWNPDADRAEGSGDWQLVEPSATDRDQLLATPPPNAAALGTQEFQQAGWTPLLESATDASSSGLTFDQHADRQ